MVENAAVDTVVGRVRAEDRDAGENGRVTYSFVAQKGAAPTRQDKNFEMEESTGVIRLRAPLDYESERRFALLVEARDAGAGSLPSYATVDVEVSDSNDNLPEISVSFLSTLRKSIVDNEEFKYEVFVPEHTKANKFIAHVSIVDKDSDENGRVDWMILINDKVAESKFLLFFTRKYQIM